MRNTNARCCQGIPAKLCLLIPLSLTFSGCGARDVSGPVPTAKLSTEKISYERKPGPTLQRLNLGELTVSDNAEPASLPVPSPLSKNTEIIWEGSLNWPKEAGKLTLVRIEFYQFDTRIGRDVTLNETLAQIAEKDGLLSFQSELTKTPVTHIGKCKIRLWGYTIPSDYDAASGIPPKTTPVILGIAETVMR